MDCLYRLLLTFDIYVLPIFLPQPDFGSLRSVRCWGPNMILQLSCLQLPQNDSFFSEGTKGTIDLCLHFTLTPGRSAEGILLARIFQVVILLFHCCIVPVLKDYKVR